MGSATNMTDQTKFVNPQPTYLWQREIIAQWIREKKIDGAIEGIDYLSALEAGVLINEVKRDMVR